MPTYEYKCPACDTTAESFVLSYKDKHELQCPLCRDEDGKPLMMEDQTSAPEGLKTNLTPRYHRRRS